MSVTKEDLGANKVRLTITVPADVFQDNIEKAYRKNRGSFSVQGFRKGHVPRAIIEKLNGSDFFYRDALEQLLPQSLAEAYDEADLNVVSQADNLTIQSMNRDDGVVYTAEVYVHPEVKLGKYEGLDVTEHVYTVTDEDVDRAIGQVREQNGRWVATEEPAAEGDTVKIDFTGRLNGELFEGGSAEDFSVRLGSQQMIPGFEEQIVGMKPEEDRTITVTFPENYGEPSLEGQEAQFDIHVHAVERLELPDLDDDFAEDVSGLATLDEYRESVREDLQNQVNQRSASNVEAQIVAQIVENSEMEVPPPMVDMQLQEDLSALPTQLMRRGITVEQYLSYLGMDVDQLQAAMRKDAERSVRTSVVLGKLVDELGTAATEEDLNKQLEAMAEKSGITLEEARKNVPQERARILADQISVAKTLERLRELSNVTVVEDETVDGTDEDRTAQDTAAEPEEKTAPSPEEENTTEPSDKDKVVEE